MSNMLGNRNQESHLEKSSSFDAMTISQKDAEIQLLRQQLEILKRELDCECQLTQIYHQKLKDTELKLRSVEDKLSTVLACQRWEFYQNKDSTTPP